MALNNGKIVDPSEIIPGRPVDWQLGNQNATDRRTYRALREMDRTKVEGSPDLPNAVVGELLVFTATGWAPQDKRTYLSLDDLTDVSVSAPTTGHILRHNGSLFVNTPISGLLSLDDLSDVTLTSPSTGAFLVKTAGDWIDQNFTPGKLGVGTTGDPTLRVELADSDHTAWFTGSPDIASSSAGWRMSKDKTKTTKRIGYALHSDGAACWEWAMESDTNNALRSGFGDSDFSLLDYSGAASAVRRIMRVSPEEAAGSATSARVEFGRNVSATPRANAAFFQINASNGTDQLTALRAYHWGGSSANGLAFHNLNTANKTCRMNWNDEWIMGPDVGALNVRHMYLAYDNVQNTSRVFVTGDSAINAKVGFGTDSPQAIVSAKTSNDSSLYDTVQRGFHMQYANQPSNRAVNIEQILDATATWNYIWMNGGLGVGSTRATRVSTSSFARAWGWECSDSEIALVSAPSGTNQTLTRLWKADNSGGNYRLGVFGVTPQAQPAAYTLTGSATRTFPADPTVAYTGAADGEAKLVDLNTLRTTLSSLIGVVRQIQTDLAGYGWLQ